MQKTAYFLLSRFWVEKSVMPAVGGFGVVFGPQASRFGENMYCAACG